MPCEKKIRPKIDGRIARSAQVRAQLLMGDRSRLRRRDGRATNASDDVTDRRSVDAVGIGEKQPLAARRSRPLMQRPGLADPARRQFGWPAITRKRGSSLRKPVENRSRCVGRAVVDDDELEIRDGLREQGTDAALDRAFLIAGRDDDRDRRRFVDGLDERNANPAGREPRGAPGIEERDARANMRRNGPGLHAPVRRPSRAAAFRHAADRRPPRYRGPSACAPCRGRPWPSRIAAKARIRSSPVGPSLRVGRAVVRDDVHMIERTVHERRERSRIFGAIVHPVEHHVLEKNLAIGLRDVALAGGHAVRRCSTCD